MKVMLVYNVLINARYLVCFPNLYDRLRIFNVPTFFCLSWLLRSIAKFHFQADEQVLAFELVTKLNEVSFTIERNKHLVGDWISFLLISS